MSQSKRFKRWSPKGRRLAWARNRANVERLEDRVQVLERIVTDRGYDIATQIEALRDTRRVDANDLGGAGVPLGLERKERV